MSCVSQCWNAEKLFEKEESKKRKKEKPRTKKMLKFLSIRVCMGKFYWSEIEIWVVWALHRFSAHFHKALHSFYYKLHVHIADIQECKLFRVAILYREATLQHPNIYSSF